MEQVTDLRACSSYSDFMENLDAEMKQREVEGNKQVSELLNVLKYYIIESTKEAYTDSERFKIAMQKLDVVANLIIETTNEKL